MAPEFVAVASQPIPYLCQRGRSTSPLAAKLKERYPTCDDCRIGHLREIQMQHSAKHLQGPIR
jgi:hypothetical protein